MEMMLPGIAPGQPTEGAIRMTLLILRLLGSVAVMGLLGLSSLANSAVLDVAGCTFDVIQLLIVVSQLTTAYYVEQSLHANVSAIVHKRHVTIACNALLCERLCTGVNQPQDLPEECQRALYAGDTAGQGRGHDGEGFSVLSCVP
jgi:hypothetical protein